MQKKALRIKHLKEVPKGKFGRFYDNKIKLENHEYSLALLLTRLGITLEAIKPSNMPKSDNPDFFIDEVIWEAKSPDGDKEKCIERNFNKASHQGDKLIFDLRRIRLPAAKAEKKAIKEFTLSRKFKHMLLVRKSGEVLEFKK